MKLKTGALKITFDRILTLLLIIMVGVLISRYFRLQPELINGQAAPNFKASLINQQTFALSDLQGHYVLLDFWGSWCAPCRRQNPGLVRLYETYKGKEFTDAAGFEIVSIGIESSDRSWKMAIEKDNLHWPYHIKDLSLGGDETFSGPVSSLYEIKSVPTSYLLDPNGIIIAVNPGKNQVKKLLSKKLK